MDDLTGATQMITKHQARAILEEGLRNPLHHRGVSVSHAFIQSQGITEDQLKGHDFYLGRGGPDCRWVNGEHTVVDPIPLYDFEYWGLRAYSIGMDREILIDRWEAKQDKKRQLLERWLEQKKGMQR
jgi:hypothetical protein